MEGLAEAGVKPLRVGFNGNVRKSLTKHSLDYKLEIHPLHPTLVTTVKEAEKMLRQMQDLEKALKDLNKKLWEAKNPKKSMIERERKMHDGVISMRAQHKNLQRKIYAIQQEMLRETVAAADVVSPRFDLSDSRLIKDYFFVDLYDVCYCCVYSSQCSRLPCCILG